MMERGLIRKSFSKRAVERGLVARDVSFDRQGDFFPIFFHPGFSTAKQVTNVSGRGVGMDVVKRAIDELRGSIDVESGKR